MTIKKFKPFNSKQEIVKQLYNMGVLCTLSKGKKGIKGWNSIGNRKKYVENALKLLCKYPNYNIAINLEASNLICIDVDDPEVFKECFNLDSETFSTFSCKTTRGFHCYLRDDLGINMNYDFKEKYGFEIHAKNHLSNFCGEGYQMNKNHTEIRHTSEFENFFREVQILYSKEKTKSKSSNPTSNTRNSSSLNTEVFNEDKEYLDTEVYSNSKEEYLYTEVYKKECSTNRQILKSLRFDDYEKNAEFIKFTFKLAFNVEPGRSMLCILHEEKNPSASVFQNEKERFLYKDFHDGKCYPLIDLLLEYHRIPQKEKGVFKIAFAYYLIALFSGSEKELKIIQILKQFNNKYLWRAFFLAASLNKLSELDNQEHFLSVRTLAQALDLKNITKSNRLLNFLCLIDVLGKTYRGFGKACKYETNVDLNIDTLTSIARHLSEIDIFRLSREKALELFDYDKVNSIYKRSENRFEYKEILKSFFLYEVYEKGLNFALAKRNQ